MRTSGSHRWTRGRSEPWRRTTAVVLARAAAALLVGVLACDPAPRSQGETREPLGVGLADLRLESIPAGAVTGTIAGEPFTVVASYYVVTRRPGHERLEIILSERPAERCSQPEGFRGSDHRLVWLRIPGASEAALGQRTVGPDGEGEMSIHYEVHDDHGWRGVGRGVGLLSIDNELSGTVAARVHLCFDDGSQSCISGTFRASECLNVVDLRPGGERFTGEDPVDQHAGAGAAAEPTGESTVAPPSGEGAAAESAGGAAAAERTDEDIVAPPSGEGAAAEPSGGSTVTEHPGEDAAEEH